MIMQMYYESGSRGTKLKRETLDTPRIRDNSNSDRIR